MSVLPHVILLPVASPRMLLVTSLTRRWTAVLSPYPYSLLQRMELAQAVLARVTGLELDEQFQCGLIGSVLETARHLLPMVFEEVRAPASRFITVPSIRSWGRSQLPAREHRGATD